MSKNEIVQAMEQNGTDYNTELLERVPGDDTEPNEFDNEPRPCEMCELTLSEEQIPLTTNRALFSVGEKLWISPICTYHDDQSTECKVRETLRYGGLQMVADAISHGLFTTEEAAELSENIDTEDVDELHTKLSENSK